MSLHRAVGHAREGGEDGFTLIELMVSSMIMLLVSAIAFGLLIRLTNADRRSQTLANNQDDVRLAIGQLTRQLRGANPFDPADSIGVRLTPTATSLRLALGPAGAGQTFVEWKYDATAHQLVKSTLASPTGTATSSTVVLTNVTAPNGGVVFQYFCPSGAPLDPASPSANTDIASFTNHIRIVLAGATTQGPAPFTIQEDVQLRNVVSKAC